MKTKTELISGFLDNSLSRNEFSRLRSLLSTDAPTQKLFAEMIFVHSLLIEEGIERRKSGCTEQSSKVVQFLASPWTLAIAACLVVVLSVIWLRPVADSGTQVKKPSPLHSGASASSNVVVGMDTDERELPDASPIPGKLPRPLRSIGSNYNIPQLVIGPGNPRTSPEDTNQPNQIRFPRRVRTPETNSTRVAHQSNALEQPLGFPGLARKAETPENGPKLEEPKTPKEDVEEGNLAPAGLDVDAPLDDGSAFALYYTHGAHGWTLQHIFVQGIPVPPPTEPSYLISALQIERLLRADPFLQPAALGWQTYDQHVFEYLVLPPAPGLAVWIRYPNIYPSRFISLSLENVTDAVLRSATPDRPSVIRVYLDIE